MKIGISTIHYAHNFGAMLQAYALKRHCEKCGCEVIMTVGYRMPKQQWNPRKIDFSSIKSILLYPKYIWKWFLPKYIPIKRRELKFEYFLDKHLNDKHLLTGTTFDVIIYGSDQIWSKFKNGYDRIWWGYDDLKTKKRISYAASMGIVDIEESDEAFIKEALSHFDAVSVREFDLYNALIEKKLIDQSHIQLAIDPTFLLHKDEWLKITSPRLVKDPYLFFYDFQEDEQTTTLVREIAKKKNLKIVRTTDGIRANDGSDIYFTAIGPAEFLSLLNYADFVFSSSFHGTAFSIIFNKQFAVRQVWNTNRVKSLLAHVNLCDRFVETKEQVEQMSEIDYDLVGNKISCLLKDSYEFINNFVNLKEQF